MKQLVRRFEHDLIERVVEIDSYETKAVRELLTSAEEVTVVGGGSVRTYRFKDSNENPTLRECMMIPDLEKRFWALSEFMDRYIANMKRTENEHR